MRVADDVNHRRKGILLSQSSHGGSGLHRLSLQEIRIPGAGDSDLLRIYRGSLCGHSGDAFIVDDRGDACRSLVDHIVLNIGNQSPQLVGIILQRT